MVIQMSYECCSRTKDNITSQFKHLAIMSANSISGRMLSTWRSEIVQTTSIQFKLITLFDEATQKNAILSNLQSRASSNIILHLFRILFSIYKIK